MIKSQPHELTYAHLWKHTNENSTRGLCLSEFIDNSVSSYLHMCGDDDNIENIAKCVIKITIDNRDPNNLKLWILDNAEGMNADELYEAAKEYHNSDEKKSNKLNQYGIGMKFSIFWFGRNGQIWSKRRDDNEYHLDYQANSHVANDSVLTPIEESLDNKIDGHGTLIMVENIYSGNNNRLLLKSTGQSRESLADALETISYRFREYFEHGLTVQIFSMTKDDPQENHVQTINSISISDVMIFKKRAFTLEKICDITDECDFTKITESQQSQLSIKRTMFKENLIKQPDIANNPDYKQLILLIDNNKPLVIDEEITINEHRLPVKLCFMFESAKKYCGVGIKHCHRFIYHLPNRTSSGSRVTGAMPFTDNERFNDGIYKWMYAEVDITDTKKYGLIPDKNKANLVWPTDQKNSWEDEFKKIIDRYASFIRLVLQKITYSTKDDKNKRFKKATQPGSFAENLLLDNNGNITCNIQNEETLSRLYHIDDSEINFIENTEINDLFTWNEIEKNKFKLEYNSDHEIMDQSSLEFNFLKLIGLLCLISNDKFSTNDNILEIINNIAKGSNIE